MLAPLIVELLTGTLLLLLVGWATDAFREHARFARAC